jgi:L-iditol 2-dehydrogenase
MKSLVYESRFLDVSGSNVLSRIGKRIGIGHELRLKNIEEPAIEDDRYVKLKTKICGICATDLSVLRNSRDPRSAASALSATKRKGQILLGHEAVAEVVETGAKVNRCKVSDRVAIADDNNCDTFRLEPCDFCRVGLPILCTNKHKRKYHGNVAAGWCEYFVRHENQLFLIPEEMNDDVAVLMEPAAVSLHSVLRSPPKRNDKVLVIGGGVIGLGIVAALRALRIDFLEIILLARYQFQRDKGLEFGANAVVGELDAYDTLSDILGTSLFGKKGNQILNKGFNSIYDCVSSSSTINDSLRWLRPRGNLFLVGMGEGKHQLDFSSVTLRELNVLGIHGYAHNSFEGKTQHTLSRCIDWVSEDRLKIKTLLTHKYPLHEYKEAIRTATCHQSKDNSEAELSKPIKVAFDFAL